jgi:hypothetical protein
VSTRAAHQAIGSMPSPSPGGRRGCSAPVALLSALRQHVTAGRMVAGVRLVDQTTCIVPLVFGGTQGVLRYLGDVRLNSPVDGPCQRSR